MPLTPDEAIEGDKGNVHLQLGRTIQDLPVDVEEAATYYKFSCIYVELPAYLQHKVQADDAIEAGPLTLNLVALELHERFGPRDGRPESRPIRSNRNTGRSSSTPAKPNGLLSWPLAGPHAEAARPAQ